MKNYIFTSREGTTRIFEEIEEKFEDLVRKGLRPKKVILGIDDYIQVYGLSVSVRNPEWLEMNGDNIETLFGLELIVSESNEISVMPGNGDVINARMRGLL